MMRTEDGDLIYRCLNGESEAFGFLVDKYRESVYGLALAMLLNFDDADDVTQEVFITAYKKLRSLRRWDCFRLWLYSITRNACKMFIRSKSKKPDIKYLEDENLETLERPSIDSYRENSDRESLNESLREALNSLPEMYRQVLSLYYLSEMTSKEISESLVISPMTVLQRLNRARALLKREMFEMMTETFENHKLAGGFTFRILESIKRIKIQPMANTNGVPWGLPLATGIMFAILIINPNFNNPAQNNVSIGNLLSGESKVLEFGEIPVNITKIADKSVMSKATGNGDGINPTKIQNAMFMDPQGEGGTWARKADMPTERFAHCAGVVNGKIYIIGGHGNLADSGFTVEEYDPATDKWRTKKANIPAFRKSLTAGVVNGKIYAIGGKSEVAHVLSTVEEYDPVADIWTKKSNMSISREAFSTSVMNGKIYAIGGSNWENGLDSFSIVEEYDPATDKWIKKADMPIARCGLSTSVVNNKIYAIGGVTVDGNNLKYYSTVEEYDPATDKWIKKSDMPTARYSHSSSVVNGKIYVIGGANENNVLSTVEVYDPMTDNWTKISDMSTKRGYFSTSEINGKIYAIGGWDENNVLLSTVEEYTPEGWPFSVSPKGKLPTTWGAEKNK
jgi:RNA polymerase sigma factor (sigma-70 family)